jgi:Cytochrome c7 and related cytochrome c
MSRETGKQRASGIPLDYFRHRNSLDRGKLILAGIAAVGTVGWLVAGSFSRQKMETWFSPGPVSAAHAMWENDCQKCHVSFTPIGGDAAATAFVGNKAAIDANCRSCHQDIATKTSPAGHHASKDPTTLACSSCHHEHRGRAESLSRMADASCTNCHAQIAEHRVGVSLLSPAAQNVSRFDAEHHPEFRSIQADRRKLKFSAATHHLHMTAGMAADARHQEIMTVGMLSAEDRARYAPGETDLNKPVPALNCGSCHQSSGLDFGLDKLAGLPSAALQANAGGAYMAPIVYENQCRACHRLTIDPGRETDSDEKLAAHVVPHRLQPDELQRTVQHYWEGQFLQKNHSQLERQLPLPSRSTQLEIQTGQDFIANGVTRSANHLRAAVCSKCHDQSDRQASHGAATESATNDETASSLWAHVQPVSIPHTWFEHAKFDHSAHRAIADCRRCHEGAYPSESLSPSSGASRPMIPGRDTCIECHGPPQESSATSRGGARFDCAECHRYHEVSK